MFVVAFHVPREKFYSANHHHRRRRRRRRFGDDAVVVGVCRAICSLAEDSLKVRLRRQGKSEHRDGIESSENAMRDDVLGHRGEHPVFRVVALVFFVSETHHVRGEEEKGFPRVVVSPSRCTLASRSSTIKVRRKKERRKGHGKKREEDRERVLTFIPLAKRRVLVSF